MGRPQRCMNPKVTQMFVTLIDCGMQMGLLPNRKVELGSKMDPSSKKAGYFRLRFITPLGGWSLFQCGFTTPRWGLISRFGMVSTYQLFENVVAIWCVSGIFQVPLSAVARRHFEPRHVQFWNRFGVVFGFVLGLFWGSFGIVLTSFWRRFGFVLGLF